MCKPTQGEAIMMHGHPDERRDVARIQAERAAKEAEEAQKRYDDMGKPSYDGNGPSPASVPNHPKDPLVPTMYGTRGQRPAFPQPHSEQEQQEQAQEKMPRELSDHEVPQHIRDRNEAGRPVKDGKPNPEGAKSEPDAAELSKEEAAKTAQKDAKSLIKK
jgi:hypothetical protein